MKPRLGGRHWTDTYSAAKRARYAQGNLDPFYRAFLGQPHMRAWIRMIIAFTIFDSQRPDFLWCRIGKNPFLPAQNRVDRNKVRDLNTLCRIGVLSEVQVQENREVWVKVNPAGPIRFGRVVSGAFLRIAARPPDEIDDDTYLMGLGLHLTAQINHGIHYGIVSGRDGKWRFGLSPQRAGHAIRKLKHRGWIIDATSSKNGKKRVELLVAAFPDRVLFDLEYLMRPNPEADEASQGGTRGGADRHMRRDEVADEAGFSECNPFDDSYFTQPEHRQPVHLFIEEDQKIQKERRHECIAT